MTRDDATTVSIRDLAQELGVSIGTVSRSLNNRYGVKPQTRARVLDAARRLGYVPNGAARRLKARPALHIGLLFAPFYGPRHEVNPYALDLIERIRRTAAAQGLGLDVIAHDGDAALADRLDADTVNVAVTLGHFEAGTYQLLHERGVPCISLEHHTGLPGQVSIHSDGQLACSQAVQYLAALGHTRIALVTGPTRAAHFRQYSDTYRAAVREFALTDRPDWHVELTVAQSNAEGAADATRRLLDGADRPTGIVYASDWLALGGLEAIRQLGQRVPADVSVVGYDNLPAAAACDPPLTTFDLPRGDIARTVVRLASELGAGKPPTGVDEQQTVYLSARLIKRASCRCLQTPHTCQGDSA